MCNYTHKVKEIEARLRYKSLVFILISCNNIHILELSKIIRLYYDSGITRSSF